MYRLARIARGACVARLRVGGRGRIVVTRAAHAHRHHAGHVEALVLDLQRVFRKRVFFNVRDVLVHAVRERQDGGDADNADAAGEGGHERAALFREQVLE